jgi:hypothetical protein
MKIGIILSLLLLFLKPIVQGQMDTSSQFEQYANHQTALIFNACEKVDTAAYQQYLGEFINQYKFLSAPDQAQFAGYLQNAYYNGSCCFSIAHSNSKAIALLQKAVAAGYNNYLHLAADKDFNNIRKEKPFQHILMTMRETSDFLYILKKHPRYDSNKKVDLPGFKYQDTQNKELQALKIGFNLDSIAGRGSDYLKMINLMHWVHTLIPHDGNHPNPEIKNALSMVAVCKKNNRGLNCRGLATVLNECYLAMGFKSRMVTCLPKDSLKNDPDCHVINAVYSGALKKWLWMDPTNDAYVMNEKGLLLSIEEVRESLINNKPLILNPSANWNNIVSKTKEDYLYQYMAKNLYKLQCAVNSKYNAETADNGKSIVYITLVPKNHYEPKAIINEKEDAGRTTYHFYETSNAAYFWQSPGTKN